MRVERCLIRGFTNIGHVNKEIYHKGFQNGRDKTSSGCIDAVNVSCKQFPILSIILAYENQVCKDCLFYPTKKKYEILMWFFFSAALNVHPLMWLPIAKYGFDL